MHDIYRQIHTYPFFYKESTFHGSVNCYCTRLSKSISCAPCVVREVGKENACERELAECVIERGRERDFICWYIILYRIMCINKLYLAAYPWHKRDIVIILSNLKGIEGVVIGLRTCYHLYMPHQAYAIIHMQKDRGLRIVIRQGSISVVTQQVLEYIHQFWYVIITRWDN